MKEHFGKMKISTDELELWDRDQDADHFGDDGKVSNNLDHK